MSIIHVLQRYWLAPAVEVYCLKLPLGEVEFDE